MKRITLLILVVALMLPVGLPAADKYTVVGGTWDINKGQFGAGVDAWQDLGLGRFFVGEAGYVSDAKAADAGGGLALGPGFWVFNNETFQLGVMAQGANAFVASKTGETNLKWGGQLVGTASYVLPDSWPAHAVTVIGRQSYIDENETNLLIGVSFKSE